MASALLEVNGLTTRFRTERGTVTAVDDVSFHVDPGETLAIVGESGSGKSVTALSVLRLIPSPPGRIERGEILFDGEDLLKLDDPGIRAVRGNKIAMIFQEPMSSLNPALTVGLQVAEPINLHRSTPWAKAYEAATELIVPSPPIAPCLPGTLPARWMSCCAMKLRIIQIKVLLGKSLVVVVISWFRIIVTR